MTDHPSEMRLALGSYLAGALDDGTLAAVRRHLDECAACRAELAELAPLPGLLATLSADAVDPGAGTPPGGTLPGLLARARTVETRNRLRLRRWRVLAGALAVAAAAAAAAVVAVVVVHVPSTPGGPTYPLRPALASASPRGGVTLVARPWGTQLVLSLRGLPAATDCLAVVTGRGGRTAVVGDWGPTADHSARVEVATSMPRTRLTVVTVETAAGTSLLTARVTAPRRRGR